MMKEDQIVPENNTQKASTTKCTRANSFLKILTKFYEIPVKKLVF